jgi:hypothetical protein
MVFNLDLVVQLLVLHHCICSCLTGLGKTLLELILGQEYTNTYRGRFGGGWDIDGRNGSRGSSLGNASLVLHAIAGARPKPEGIRSRI